MCETTKKYKLPTHFSKAKLACYPFSTIYYSNVFTFPLKKYPHLRTYKVDLNMPACLKFTQELQEVTRELLVMLVTFRMSAYYSDLPGLRGDCRLFIGW